MNYYLLAINYLLISSNSEKETVTLYIYMAITKTDPNTLTTTLIFHGIGLCTGGCHCWIFKEILSPKLPASISPALTDTGAGGHPYITSSTNVAFKKVVLLHLKQEYVFKESKNIQS